jgi:hypothetical protein
LQAKVKETSDSLNDNKFAEIEEQIEELQRSKRELEGDSLSVVNPIMTKLHQGRPPPESSDGGKDTVTHPAHELSDGYTTQEYISGDDPTPLLGYVCGGCV